MELQSSFLKGRNVYSIDAQGLSSGVVTRWNHSLIAINIVCLLASIFF